MVEGSRKKVGRQLEKRFFASLLRTLKQTAFCDGGCPENAGAKVVEGRQKKVMRQLEKWFFVSLLQTPQQTTLFP